MVKKTRISGSFCVQGCACVMQAISVHARIIVTIAARCLHGCRYAEDHCYDRCAFATHRWGLRIVGRQCLAMAPIVNLAACCLHGCWYAEDHCYDRCALHAWMLVWRVCLERNLPAWTQVCRICRERNLAAMAIIVTIASRS